MALLLTELPVSPRRERAGLRCGYAPHNIACNGRGLSLPGGQWHDGR